MTQRGRHLETTNMLNKAIIGSAYKKRGRSYTDENSDAQEVRNNSYSGKNVLTVHSGGVRDYGGNSLVYNDFDVDSVYTWQGDNNFDNIVGLKKTSDNKIILKNFFLAGNNLSDVNVSEAIRRDFTGDKKLFIYRHSDGRILEYPSAALPGSFEADVTFNNTQQKGFYIRDINDDFINENDDEIYYDLRFNINRSGNIFQESHKYIVNFVGAFGTIQLDINGAGIKSNFGGVETANISAGISDGRPIDDISDFFIRMVYNKASGNVVFNVLGVDGRLNSVKYYISTNPLTTNINEVNFREGISDGYINMYSYFNVFGRSRQPGFINKIFMYGGFDNPATTLADYTKFNAYDLSDTDTSEITITDAQTIGSGSNTQNIALWTDAEMYGTYKIADIDLKDLRHFVYGDTLRLYHSKGYAPPIDMIRSYDKNGVVSFKAQLVENRNHLNEFETEEELNNYMDKAGFPGSTTERAKYWFKTNNDEDVFADVRFNGPFADGNYYQIHRYNKTTKTFSVVGLKIDIPYDSPAQSVSFLPNNRYYVVPFNKYVGYPKIMEITSNRVSIFGGIYNPIGWHCSSSFSIYNFIRASKTSEVEEELGGQDTTVLPSHGFYRQLPAIPVQVETTGGILTIYTEQKPIILDSNLDATKVGTVDFKQFYPFVPDKKIPPVGMDNMLFLINETGELYTQSIQTYTSNVNEITLNHNPATSLREPEEDGIPLFKKYRVTKMVYIRDDEDYQKRMFCFCGDDNVIIIYNSDTASSHFSYDLIDFNEVVKVGKMKDENGNEVVEEEKTDYKIVDLFSIRNKLYFISEYNGVRAIETWNKNTINFNSKSDLFIKKTIKPTLPLIARFYNAHLRIRELLFDFWDVSDNIKLKNLHQDRRIGIDNAEGNLKGNHFGKLRGTVKLYTPSLFVNLNRTSGDLSDEILNIETNKRLYLKSIRHNVEYTVD